MLVSISIFYFSYFASIASLIIYAPNMFKELGYNSLQIGILFSILPLVRFLNPFLFINILKLDFFIIKNSMILNFISIVLFYFSVNNFYLLMASILLYSISVTQFLPYIETIAIEYLDKSRYGKIRLFGSIGFIAIALVMPYFRDILLAPINTILITSSIMFVSIIAISINIKKKTQQIDDKIQEVFLFAKIWPFWVAIFLMQFSFGGLYNFFTIYILENKISLDTISYLWTFGVLCEIVIFFYQRYFLSKHSLMAIIRFCIVLTSIRWLIVFLYPDIKIALFLSQILHAFSFALFHSACIYYLSSQYKNKALAQLFYLGISFGLGGFAGALFSGLAYGKWLFLYESIIALIAFLILKVTSKRIYNNQQSKNI